jgi:thioredoxin-like negative regulator of GroEL
MRISKFQQLCILLLFLCFLSSEAANTTNKQTLKLKNQAAQLTSKGDYSGAMRLLNSIPENAKEPSILERLLELQIRLKLNSEAEQTIEMLQNKINGWPDRLNKTKDFRTAGKIAGAWYRLNEQNKADSVWKSMRVNAKQVATAHAVFSSYRQVRLNNEAINWVNLQRNAFSDPGLWALDISTVYEEMGQYENAFSELVSYVRNSKSKSHGFVTQRVLKLLDHPDDKEELLSFMDSTARVELKSAKTPIAKIVLDAMVQYKKFPEATNISWALDADSTGMIPFNLARTFADDKNWKFALIILDQIEQKNRPIFAGAEFGMLKGVCLGETGKYAEALDILDQVSKMKSHLMKQSLQAKASIYHYGLGQIDAASVEISKVLKISPDDNAAKAYQILLLAARDEFSAAEKLLGGIPKSTMKSQVELQFYQIKIAWWQGDINKCRALLPLFLRNQSAHPIFNDAIDLMDLFSFAATDSVAVAAAGKADLLAWRGQKKQSISMLSAAAIDAKDSAAEWLNWLACVLAIDHLPYAETLALFDTYKERHKNSIRLDRLEFMEINLSEKRDTNPVIIHELCLDFLNKWPESILQDQVRRKIRELEDRK